MKKNYIFKAIIVIIFGTYGCGNEQTSENVDNPNDPTIEATIDDENQTNEEELISEFEIVNITKSEFNDKGTYELHFELKNKSSEKFSKVWLNAVMKYILPDGKVCDAHFQTGPGPDLKPVRAENWLPNSVIQYTMISPDHRNVAGCHVDLDRTPKSINLEITLSAISVDREIKEELIVVYDLLPIWKEKQKSLGLR